MNNLHFKTCYNRNNREFIKINFLLTQNNHDNSLVPCEKFKVSVVLFAGLEATVEVAQDFHRVVLRLLGTVLLVQSVETVNDDEHVI